GGNSGGETGGSASGEAGGSTTMSFGTGRVTVTGVRGKATPTASSTILLHNYESTAVEISGLELSGPDAALFKLNQALPLPMILAAGEDLAVAIELSTNGAELPNAPANKDSGSVLLSAKLTATSASDSAVANVYGLVLTQAN